MRVGQRSGVEGVRGAVCAIAERSLICQSHNSKRMKSAVQRRECCRTCYYVTAAMPSMFACADGPFPGRAGTQALGRRRRLSHNGTGRWQVVVGRPVQRFATPVVGGTVHGTWGGGGVGCVWWVWCGRSGQVGGAVGSRRCRWRVRGWGCGVGESERGKTCKMAKCAARSKTRKHAQQNVHVVTDDDMPTAFRHFHVTRSRRHFSPAHRRPTATCRGASPNASSQAPENTFNIRIEYGH